ncbi:hypothetical protein FRACYDRAFT_263883 [Fragilariopsis cylindrus CCMP1102]|uniref:Uncharacterized protein n=1 Tax=Fragilariopsis cylindrus CCMP1102 TaxID=635003 RepID=A0A1E7EX75_9STRA|nr:hypothetical protein FRACYDRAFT_263883 [Fragilariopsis cylindrus CCMP1102]|eukprot:OEU10415.1 hypothetical protein FRACYDRAFT_263883 [Fragilariopsis cylindrus CCMP1102]
MLACSSFTMPFIECGGGYGAAEVLQEPLSPLSLYSPPIGSESCSIEERLQQTKNQLKNLKDVLLTKENDHDDQQQEIKFYIIKNEELMDVINTFRCPSEKKAHKLMILKSEQNSELTLQVHSLRDLLQKSGIEIASLTKQIQSLNYKVDSLTNIKDKNQKLQIQINELVQIVNKVDVTITPEIGVDGGAADHDDIASEWNVQWLNNMILPKSVGGNNAAVDETESESDDTTKSNIQMITRKVITMEADRQRLLKESLQVNQNIDGICKADQIASLERKVRSMQYEQDTLQETNSALRRQMCVREGKILALEELFQNINTKNRNINNNKKNKTRKVIRPSADSQYRIERSVSLMNCDEFDDDDCDDDEDLDINSVTSSGTSKQQSFEEMFTSIWTTFSSPVENIAQNLIVGSRSNNNNNNGSSYLEEEGEELDEMDDINIDDSASSDSSSCHDEMTSSCGAFSVTGDSYHTKQVEEELQAAAQKEYNELHNNHHKLCEDYESSQLRITDLTARLEESIIKATSFEKKSELREGLLKDVIQQYKELQLENSTCKDHLRKVKQKVTVLLQFEKERSEQEEQERKNNEEAAVAADAVTAATDGQQKVIGVSKKGGNTNNNGGFLEEETPTFDMSENGDGNEGDEDDGSTSSSLSTSSASSSMYTTNGLPAKKKER